MAAIYYLFAAPPITGGDFVAVDHVAALDRMGFNAKVFYCAPDGGAARFSVPVTGMTAILPGDVVVAGENQDEIFAQLRDHPCIRVLHNQNPFYTFHGFESIAALNAYPLAHILTPSDFCVEKLRAMGVCHPISRVHPALPDYFAPAAKTLRITFAPGKRPVEASFLPGYFRARAPEYAHVPWTMLAGMTRRETAAAMAGAAIHAALPLLEGLGLMNLEAMASGCHVVGYTGLGGAEYATPGNGDWITDGDHDGFAEELRTACRLHESGADNPKIAAGRDTAARFSHSAFEAQLLAAWTAILGESAPRYRK